MISKVAVVTGAAGAIGASVAKVLAESGYLIVATDKSSQVEALAEGLKAAGHKAAAYILDLRVAGNDAAIAGFADEIVSNHGRCDVLVNNAGIHPFLAPGKVASLEETSLDDWDMVLDINLKAPFLLSREFFPVMKRQNYGRIINVTSRAARTMVYANVSYSASKSGLAGLTRILAAEGGKHGITANSVAPGGSIMTEMSKQLPPELHEKYREATIVNRTGFPEDIAAAVDFLASEKAGYITGVHLDVNGGFFMSS